MEIKLSLINLYEAVVGDCELLIEKNVDKKYVEEMRKEVGYDLNKKISLYRIMIKDSLKKGNIRTYSLEYLDNMLSYIEKNKSDEIKDDEIFAAYAYLFSFAYINDLSEIGKICKFEFTNYIKFSEILEKYGDSDILKKNYEISVKQKINGKVDNKNLKNLFTALIKKKLTQNKTEKNQKENKNKNKNSRCNLQIVGNISPNSNTLKGRYEDEEKKPNDIKINEEPKEQNNQINELNRVTLNSEIEASQKISKNANSDTNKEINNTSKKEINNENNNTKGDINNSKKEKTEINDNIIKLDNNTNISSKKGETNANNKKINKEIIHDNNYNSGSNDIKGNINLNNKRNLNNIVKEDNKNNIKNSDELGQRKNISYEKLVDLVFSLEKKLENHSERIEKLENNQKLMYYQISMYQSRDISKSIYYYFVKHLNIPNAEKPFFDLKEIMEYLNKSDDGKYSQEDKKKLIKFFKSLFFINKVHNKILHHNLTTKVQQTINQIKDKNDLLSFIPTSSYEQLFDSLGFYIENNIKNEQLQEAMKYVYDQEYINDNGLAKIKDEEKEAIERDKEFVKMLITKEEINDVKMVFSKIKDFELLCNLKTWDD